MAIRGRLPAYASIVLLLTLVSTATAKYSGGTGEPNDPYQIATAADLIALGETPEDYDKHFILTADIDLDPNLPGRKVFDRAVIAPDVNDVEGGFQGIPFTGVFDGKGHTLSHLTISGASDLGLFGRVLLGYWPGAKVESLALLDVNIMGSGDCIGGLVGSNDSAFLSHCYSTGEVRGKDQVGGLVGHNLGHQYASIHVTHCYSAATVDGNNMVGGLAGLNSGSLTDCYSTGVVDGNDFVGGLVGGTAGGTITNCYSMATVSGRNGVAGLLGLVQPNCTSLTSYPGVYWHPAHISQSYSAGAVTGENSVGGLVGCNQDLLYLADMSLVGHIEQCFWDTQASSQTTSDGGTGRTTAEMQTAQTFLDAGWNFVGETANGTEDIWWILEGKDYPKLSWQGPAGMVFVDIPGGTFEMGDHDGVGWPEERPVHTVTLTSFQMSKYETTNAQYAQYLNAAMAGGLIQVVNGVVYASSDESLTELYCHTYGSHGWSQIEYADGLFIVRSRDDKTMSDHPVNVVWWYGAKAFCDYYGYRLPTEAEWEYAARGGYHDPYYQYPWGSNTIDCTKANYYNGNSYCNPLNLTSMPYTSPVGYYGPQGAYGLCDMSGNVWEWCQDWRDEGYYSVSPESNPTGPTAGRFRVQRGGSWSSYDIGCRVANRSRFGPDNARISYIGFRVCR